MKATTRIFDRLRQYESRNVTYLEPDGTWPVAWKKAKGVHVWDEEGRRYLDLTAAFGVAAAGHANPQVVRAGRRQLAQLPHAMGDVHPHALKADLAKQLSALTFERWTRDTKAAKARAHGKTIFCNSGFEAVEAALKTAMLYTGRERILAFEGAYHGLGYGALNATHRNLFASPFRRQLGRFGRFIRFPESDEDTEAIIDAARKQLDTGKFGAVLMEPIQGRGGMRIAPDEFLIQLRRLCDQTNTLLILDEIYTGFGRTGKWFACEHAAAVPDLVCLGKAMTGGFPMSACVGRSDVMDQAWPASEGEAIHTSTFLGNPVGCAMALAQIDEIRRLKLPQQSTRLGKRLLTWLHALGLPDSPLRLKARGRGLMAGLEATDPNGRPATSIVIGAMKALLKKGYLFLPAGPHSNVLCWTPPLCISETELKRSVEAAREALLDQSKCAA